MKLEQYISELDGEEQLEGGLLSELEMEEPPALHSKLMGVIKKEKSRSKFNLFRYRNAAIAAIFLFIVCLNLMFGFINNGAKKESMDLNSKRAQSQEKSLGVDQSKITADLNSQNAADSKSDAHQEDEAASIKKSIIINIIIEGDNKQVKEFIENKGTKIENNLYKIKNEDFEILKTMVEGKNISVDEGNEVISEEKLREIISDGKYKVIRIIIK